MIHEAIGDEGFINKTIAGLVGWTELAERPGLPGDDTWWFGVPPGGSEGAVGVPDYCHDIAELAAVIEWLRVHRGACCFMHNRDAKMWETCIVDAKTDAEIISAASDSLERSIAIALHAFAEMPK